MGHIERTLPVYWTYWGTLSALSLYIGHMGHIGRTLPVYWTYGAHWAHSPCVTFELVQWNYKLLRRSSHKNLYACQQLLYDVIFDHFH